MGRVKDEEVLVLVLEHVLVLLLFALNLCEHILHALTSHIAVPLLNEFKLSLRLVPVLREEVLS